MLPKGLRLRQRCRQPWLLRPSCLAKPFRKAVSRPSPWRGFNRDKEFRKGAKAPAPANRQNGTKSTGTAICPPNMLISSAIRDCQHREGCPLIASDHKTTTIPRDLAAFTSRAKSRGGRLGRPQPASERERLSGQRSDHVYLWIKGRTSLRSMVWCFDAILRQPLLGRQWLLGHHTGITKHLGCSSSGKTLRELVPPSLRCHRH